MRKLDRAAFPVPAKWQESVRKAFPDWQAFVDKATEFEALDVDCEDRRKGFKSYAPGVLPKSKQGVCDFKAIWGRLKEGLKNMCHQKCAYCESVIATKRTGAVEHFKPKSLFPSLAYDCDNYFLGCGGCNGAKSDKWPMGGGSYVRPDEGDPALLFVFHEDGRVEAAQPSGAAEHTIRDFQLNEEWLCAAREWCIGQVIEELESLLEKPGIPIETKRQLASEHFARIQQPGNPYSLALKQCYERAWKERSPSEAL